MYLADTNIFLEVLLGQANQAKCEAFLKAEWDNIFISDFALHSIGVAQEYGLEIVTQDADFRSVQKDISVRFIA